MVHSRSSIIFSFLCFAATQLALYIKYIRNGKFSSVQSHLFLSPIGAWTLKMPVPYLPPNVEVYTQTPSHQPLVFGRWGTDHLP